MWRSCDSGGDLDVALPVSETAPPIEGSEPTAPGNIDRLVDVGGHRLHVRTFGAGSPAVVIEPGIGDAGQVWGGVIDTLATETLVVLYARAGYGRSEAGPVPRSADRSARELSALLTATPVEPPYVLVAHSLGAINALVYASENSHLLAGVVLLDPPPLDFIRGNRFPELREMADQMTAGFERDAAQARDAGDDRQADWFEAMASEHNEMFESGWQLMASVRSLGDLPLVVVASGVPNTGFGQVAGEFQSFWRDSSEELARLSTRGRFVFVENSTHDIPGDAPGVVVDAVQYCIDESRRDYAPAWYEGDK